LGDSLTIHIIPEESINRFQDKDFRVSVSGWSKPRLVHWRKTDLFMEITAKDCICNTCIRRFESVLFSMRDRQINYEVGSWSKDCSVRFNNPQGFEESEIAEFLSEQIGLQVVILEELPIEQGDKQ
jgi:hypothetical protein